MSALRFVKTDPTQNMTVLVRDPVPRAAQVAVAARLMARDSVSAEQVGFIEPPAPGSGAAARLQMMGGEFCGNAAMSLAAVLLWDGGRDGGDVILEVSGCAAPVVCRMAPRGPDAMTGTVDMPLPERTGEVSGCPAVFLPGITHIIAPAADLPDPGEAEAFLRRTAPALEAPCAGLLLFDRQAMALTPCVYVKATDSAVWERGCASGTAALGAYLALTEGAGETALRLPGGTMTARARVEGGHLASLSVTGGVRRVCEGIAWIEA